MHAMLLLIGFLMLAYGVLIGVFHKVTLLSPANAVLFEKISPPGRKKLCRKFCVIPLLNAAVLIGFAIVGSVFSFSRNVYLVPLCILLLLSMYDTTRLTTILNKIRTHSFHEKTDL